MQTDLQPKQLAAAAVISASHASNILGGKRAATTDIALAAFRAFGIRLGLLAEMTDADISQLCAQNSEAGECHGGDAAASDSEEQRFDVSTSLDTDGLISGHDAVLCQAQDGSDDSGAADGLSTGHDGQLSRELAAFAERSAQSEIAA